MVFSVLDNYCLLFCCLSTCVCAIKNELSIVNNEADGFVDISVSFLSASHPKSIATLYLYLKTYITNHNCLLCWESNLAGHSWIPPPSWQDHVTCVTISASRQPLPARISKSTPTFTKSSSLSPCPCCQCGGQAPG